MCRSTAVKKSRFCSPISKRKQLWFLFFTLVWLQRICHVMLRQLVLIMQHYFIYFSLVIDWQVLPINWPLGYYMFFAGIIYALYWYYMFFAGIICSLLVLYVLCWHYMLLWFNLLQFIQFVNFSLKLPMSFCCFM